MSYESTEQLHTAPLYCSDKSLSRETGAEMKGSLNMSCNTFLLKQNNNLGKGMPFMITFTFSILRKCSKDKNLQTSESSIQNSCMVKSN